MFSYLYNFMVEILIKVIFMFNFNILKEIDLNYLNIKKLKKYLVRLKSFIGKPKPDPTNYQT